MSNTTKDVPCPHQYENWSIQQLAGEMKPHHYGFALVAGHTRKHSRAYGNHVAQGDNRRNHSTAAAYLIKRHPGVRAVISKVRAREDVIDSVKQLLDGEH